MEIILVKIKISEVFLEKYRTYPGYLSAEKNILCDFFRKVKKAIIKTFVEMICRMDNFVE